MPQVKQGVSVDKPSKKKNQVECKWSSCKKHPKKINYPNKGRVTKGGYRGAWIKLGMCPWNLYATTRKRLWKNGKAIKTHIYQFEAHHLLPTTLVNKTSTLKENAVLIDYNCDDAINGLLLPKHKMDSPVHKLPIHKGMHPNDGYMTPIKKKLEKIEEDYDGICKDDAACTAGPQANLKSELEAISQTAKQKIFNIRSGKNYWSLTKNALHTFRDAEKEYQRRLELNKQLESE